MDTAARLDALVDAYPFKPYRHYRAVSRRMQGEVMRAELAKIRHTPGALVGSAGDGEGCVFALVRPLAWDSAFFGLPMARLECVLRGEAAGAAEIDAAIADALTRCRVAGLQHVSARFDAEDAATLAAAERQGFRLMDTLLTYFTHPKGPAPTVVREVGRIRSFAPGDAAELLEISREAFAGFGGRFQRDPHLPADRAADFYMEWSRQCVAGVMAERILVAEGETGGLIGWAGVRAVQPFSSVSGVTMWAGSLGACRRDTPGAYAGLIREAAAVNHARGEVTETQTPASNVSTANIYEAVGARFVRADHTLHAWLG
ncbi:MAG: hypothetical protein ABI880_14405 [Acidobacteriota bacterium]